jgi:hypothetical protein
MHVAAVLLLLVAVCRAGVLQQQDNGDNRLWLISQAPDDVPVCPIDVQNAVQCLLGDPSTPLTPSCAERYSASLIEFDWTCGPGPLGDQCKRPHFDDALLPSTSVAAIDQACLVDASGVATELVVIEAAGDTTPLPDGTLVLGRMRHIDDADSSTPIGCRVLNASALFNGTCYALPLQVTCTEAYAAAYGCVSGNDTCAERYQPSVPLFPFSCVNDINGARCSHPTWQEAETLDLDVLGAPCIVDVSGVRAGSAIANLDGSGVDFFDVLSPNTCAFGLMRPLDDEQLTFAVCQAANVSDVGFCGCIAAPEACSTAVCTQWGCTPLAFNDTCHNYGAAHIEPAINMTCAEQQARCPNINAGFIGEGLQIVLYNWLHPVGTPCLVNLTPLGSTQFDVVPAAGGGAPYSITVPAGTCISTVSVAVDSVTIIGAITQTLHNQVLCLPPDPAIEPPTRPYEVMGCTCTCGTGVLPCDGQICEQSGVGRCDAGAQPDSCLHYVQTGPNQQPRVSPVPTAEQVHCNDTLNRCTLLPLGEAQGTLFTPYEWQPDGVGCASTIEPGTHVVVFKEFDSEPYVLDYRNAPRPVCYYSQAAVYFAVEIEMPGLQGTAHKALVRMCLPPDPAIEPPPSYYGSFDCDCGCQAGPPPPPSPTPPPPTPKPPTPAPLPTPTTTGSGSEWPILPTVMLSASTGSVVLFLLLALLFGLAVQRNRRRRRRV